MSLERFVEAQDSVYAEVLRELAAGRKASHWMWFVFPQFKGLGFSPTAHFYGLDSLAEARAYWKHPLLGARLRECCELTLAIEGRSAREIFSTPDDLKLRSCLTLFARAVPEEPLFQRLLDKYFGGAPDLKTLELLT